ncbi:FRG domain-containing protein [Streptococcus mutans]|uniref:FRG domain-containing protein n=1 Tax=Streptococcus mutans TaxID=1309 RepID=UPI00274242EC|nr:FRG domain-containing protein [Streptococcus mutans]MDP5885789.1 FRG domain-containing protein [Streptococcus mutans]MDW5546577.1 FRG domain-containing protein [Streptococcus mutans]
MKSSNNIEDREYQLSLLQHYGFKTSLLDITSNPYIAMLFMLSEQFTEYKEPAFFLFQVDENLHRNKHLFTEVRKSKLNERILAQKGAFLNFDKIFSNKAFDIERILSIKIVLHFSDKKYLDYIASEKEKLSQIELAESSKIDNGQSDYFALLEKEEKEIEQSKIECLRFIKDELSQKLREYYYFEEVLFPDFEKRLQYLSNKYESSGSKKISL